MIQQDLKGNRLKKEDTGDRNKWRRRIHAADPFPERDQFKPEGNRNSDICELTRLHHKMNN